MPIRKFIEEIGEKVLPAHRNAVRGGRQQQQFSWSSPTQHGSSDLWQSPFSNSRLPGDNECAEAIRRYIVSRPGLAAPGDLTVLFHEDDGFVILAGTPRDEKTREFIVQVAGHIQGVERVDDRMRTSAEWAWR
jgi:osmotically-inducible protein OsmY